MPLTLWLQRGLLLACVVQTRCLQPLGSAKEPARRRETAAVLGCDHRLGAVAYGYLQRLGAVHESGLREPVALLKGNMQRRKLSSVLSSAFLGALNPRRAVDVGSGAALARAVSDFDVTRCVAGEAVAGSTALLNACCASGGWVGAVAVGDEAAAAARELLEDRCGGSLVVAVENELEDCGTFWNFRRGCGPLDGRRPRVEDAAAALCAGALALPADEHVYVAPGGADGAAWASPLEAMDWILEASAVRAPPSWDVETADARAVDATGKPWSRW